MSAAGRLPFIFGTLSVCAVVLGLVTVPALREAVAGLTGVSAPGGLWRVLAIGFALINIKSLPFVWHWRVFRHLFHHIYFSPHPMTAPTLFSPLITTSYASPLEIDYNLHKSNSTYFSDLDASRAALMGALIRNSLIKLNRGDVSGLSEEVVKAKGRYIVALGGIACTFRKEIAVMQGYEVWSKVLTWDEKWIYVISHMVKRGAKKPTRYWLQPWKKTKSSTNKTTEKKEEEQKDWTKSVFATSIAKYVCKKGRLTVPPEVFLRRGDLIPEKKASYSAALRPTSSLPLNSPPSPPSTPGIETPKNETFTRKSEAPKPDLSTWEGVERERLRGLQIAKNFDSLALLHGEFGGDDEVLGKYDDFFFW